MHKLRKTLKKKQTKRSGKRRNCSSMHKKNQRGGVGYTTTDCRIGGLSEVRAYSECPQDVGPGDAAFAKTLYEAPILFSGSQTGGSRRKKRTKSKSPSRRRGCRK